MSRAALETRLRDILDQRYHDRHPFNQRMMAGELSEDEVRRWVRNRYYYQTRIPIKDGMILTKAEDREFRRSWIRRIHDHDGDDRAQGGLELWLSLAVATGQEREAVASLARVLPGVRRACDRYVQFVDSHDLLESVAASLTELSAGPYLGRRAEAFRTHYPWIAEEGLAYFLSRTEQAPRDAQEGMAFVLEHAKSAEDEDRCAAALEEKCQILWDLLDGVEWGARRPTLASAAMLRADPEHPGQQMIVLPERAVKLGGSGSGIVAACDGERDVEAVAAFLRENHPEPEDLERDVFHFIEEMEKLGALTLQAEKP